MTVRTCARVAVLVGILLCFAVFATGCSRNGTSSEDTVATTSAQSSDNLKAIAQDFVETRRQLGADTTGLLRFYAEDAVIEDAELGTRYEGRAAIKGFLAGLRLTSGWTRTTQSVGAGDDWFAFQQFDVDPEGQGEITWFVVSEVHDGLITYQWQTRSVHQLVGSENP